MTGPGRTPTTTSSASSRPRTAGVAAVLVCAVIALVITACALLPGAEVVTGRSLAGDRTGRPAPSTGTSARPLFPARLDVATLRRSMVHMDVIYDGYHEYTNQCSGTKVSVDGRVFVMSAAHCLAIGKDDYLAGRPARVATALARYPFAVDVSRTDGAPDSPFFRVTAIAESQTADVALFQVDPRPLDAGRTLPLRFTDVPALPIQRYLGLTHRAGQSSRSSSFPASAGGRVDSAGRFLGRARGVNGPHLQALDDVVGLLDTGAGDTQQHDACLFGGSGSLAVLSGGAVTGPLSGRLRTRLYHDGSLADEDLSLADARIDAEYIERAVHTTVTPYPTVCLYTVLTDRILRDLVALLPR